MRIIFSRHGESTANVQHTISNRQLPHGLTSTGCEQAARLARSLLDRSVTQIYSSPVQRAVETASIIAGALDLRFTIVEALREFDCGTLEGRSDEAAWEQWQVQIDSWLIGRHIDQHMPGGESFTQVRQRFVPFIEELIDHYSDTKEVILCISHGGLYHLMLPLILPIASYPMIASKGLPYCSCIIAEYMNGSLVCTEWNGDPVIAPQAADMLQAD